MDLSQIYRPITATPFECGESYIEVEPCAALKPYIRCFWGTVGNIRAQRTADENTVLVIPDTCMDIIFDVNYTQSRSSCFFCGINDAPFASHGELRGDVFASFAIRFYAWSAVLFADEDMSDVLNTADRSERYFKGIESELEGRITECGSIFERIEIAERFLLKRLNSLRENPDLMNAVYFLLKTEGNIRIEDLSMYTAASRRKLERLFKSNIGLTPKKLASLIRYQRLWQSMVAGNFDVQDCVMRFGFSDQPHLLNEFRRYHSMNPTAAIELAGK